LIIKRRGKRPLGIPGHGWEDNDKVDVNEIVCRAWTGFIWLRIGTVGGFF